MKKSKVYEVSLREEVNNIIEYCNKLSKKGYSVISLNLNFWQAAYIQSHFEEISEKTGIYWLPWEIKKEDEDQIVLTKGFYKYNIIYHFNVHEDIPLITSDIYLIEKERYYDRKGKLMEYGW